jgi:hypothetical protein
MDREIAKVERSVSIRLAITLTWAPLVVSMLWLDGTNDPLRGSPLWPFDGHSAVAAFALGALLSALLYVWLRARPEIGRGYYLAAGVLNGSIVGIFFTLASKPDDDVVQRLPHMYLTGIGCGIVISQIIYGTFKSDERRHGPDPSLERTRD